MKTKLPDHPTAADSADSACVLGSELLHDGCLAHHDVDRAGETRKIGYRLWLVSSRSPGLNLHAPAAA